MRKDERGEMMVEGSIALLVSIFVFFFLLNISVAVYHQEIVTIEANRVATDVANAFGEAKKDPLYEFQDPSYFKKCYPYRYLKNNGTDYEKQIKKKAKWYAGYCLSKHEFGEEVSGNWDNVKVTVSTNSLGMKILTVDITREYKAFALAPMGIFGINNTYKVSATGKAVCYDIVHDMSNAELYHDVKSQIIGSFALTDGLSNVEAIIDQVKSLID